MGAGVAELALHLLDPGISGDLASAMIFFLIKETLPPERRQLFTFVPLLVTLRRCSVISVSELYACQWFQLCRDVLVLKRRPFVYIEINHVAPENFGYYFH